MLHHKFLNGHFFLSFFLLVKLLWQQVIHPPMHLIQITTHMKIKLQLLQHIHGIWKAQMI